MGLCQKTCRYFLFLLLPFVAARGAVGDGDASADLILFNGKIWTVDTSQPVAQAVAVRGAKIVKVGADAEVLALKNSATELIDLHGRLVLPGFNDAHTHFENAVGWFFQVMVMA